MAARPRGGWGRGQRPGACGSGLALQRVGGRGSRLGPVRSPADDQEAGPAGPQQPMDARPPSSYKGPERGRRGGWGGGARQGLRRRGGGRAGPQAVAAGPWRRRPLLRVPGCSSSCWPLRQRWSRGRRVSGGGAGGRLRGARAGPGLWLAPSFSNMARARGRRWRRRGPGWAFWPGSRHASRGRGTEAGRGACVRM